MRSLFVKIFLRFWLTVAAVGLALAVAIVLSLPRSKGPGSTKAAVATVFVFELPLITLIGGGVFCYLITRNITRPLYQLRSATAAFADGHLETRVGASLGRRHDEIAALGDDFDRMAERIEMLVTAQQRLLGDVSHELRSPLSRLVVALSLVKQRPAEASEHVARIRLEVSRLDALIGQLLMLSRMNSGAHAVARASVDLTNLVHEIASDADFEARARGRAVIVTAAEVGSIEGFEEVLRSAVENVVRNAVRHTRDGTSVEIVLSEKRRGDERQAVLSVRDHGPGVPDSMLSEMFLPFRRVVSSAEVDVEGTGLGLAITARAVSLHGGSVHAKNAPGGGLVVEIEIPL